jgi:hypothetical protein
VDDFGVKYIGQNHADHLLSALRDLYPCTVDWTGTKYIGLTLAWDYTARTVDLSMPGYIRNALHCFQHPPPSKPEHSIHAWVQPSYGAPIQLAPPLDDTTPLLDAPQTKRLQQVILGTLLLYARAVDPMMLVTLGTLTAAQIHGTEAPTITLIRLLNYAATHPDAKIRHPPSDMILHIHSDASYVSVAKACSRVGGHFYLSSKLIDPTKPPINAPPSDGAIHTVCNILKNVMSSATEAEFAGLFHNAKEGAMIRNILEELGWPQPPTPIQTDNS